MRALITGITGFVGSHLAELLLEKGYDVAGTVRWRSDTTNIAHIMDKIKLIECDIRDAYSFKKALEHHEPEEVYHLAAQSFVPTSWHAPQETLTTNIIGTVNLFEGIRLANIDPVIQFAGSSEEYGLVNEDEVPITESQPLRPLSPYGVSKVACDRLSFQYNKSYGLKIVITRAFNHSGPRRGQVFVDSNFAKQIAEIEKGKRQFLQHGNLDAKRDFTDVRDVVRAYLLAAQKCEYGAPYNICSGTSRSIKEMMDTLLKLTSSKVEIRADAERMRPSDVLILVGDYSKFRQKTGWKPEIAYEQTLKDMLDYWRSLV